MNKYLIPSTFVLAATLFGLYLYSNASYQIIQKIYEGIWPWDAFYTVMTILIFGMFAFSCYGVIYVLRVIMRIVRGKGLK